MSRQIVAKHSVIPPASADSATRVAFLLLVLTQAAHSIEEYSFKLYEVFGPARFVSGLLSEDLRRGFIVFNVALVAFGLWCYVARVKPARASADRWIWLWALLELGNAIGHPVIALARRGYFPGLMTAPALLLLSAYLISRLVRRIASD